MTSNWTNGPDLWDAILLKLGPDAYIAGGAVRDYILGTEPKDIDVFLYKPGDVVANKVWTYLEGDVNGGYAEGLEVITYRYLDCHIPVQIIRTVKYPDPQEHFDTFDLSTSRCQYSLKSGLTTTPEFEESINTGVVKILNSGPKTPERIRRLTTKYQGRFHTIVEK